MTNLQRWLLISAVWVIAISLFIIGLEQRYGVGQITTGGGGISVLVDKWNSGYLISPGNRHK